MSALPTFALGPGEDFVSFSACMKKALPITLASEDVVLVNNIHSHRTYPLLTQTSSVTHNKDFVTLFLIQILTPWVPGMASDSVL